MKKMRNNQKQAKNRFQKGDNRYFACKADAAASVVQVKTQEEMGHDGRGASKIGDTAHKWRL